jgi:adenosylhomocysteine nucleosidase
MAVSCVGVLGAMRLELKPLIAAYNLRKEGSGVDAIFRGHAGTTKVVATTMQMGTVAATKATERLLDAGTIDHVVVIGVAGGVGPTVTVRDLIVPEVVLDGASGKEYRPAPLPGFEARGILRTGDDFLTDHEPVAALAAEGVIALDMETAACAAVCERRGVPWSVARGLSDHNVDAPVDSEVLGLATPDGGANYGALARYLLPRPWKLLHLARLARDTTAAANVSVRALQQALPNL